MWGPVGLYLNTMQVVKVLVVSLLLFAGFSLSKEVGFTQEDRERLVRLEATLKVFMEQIDKRFEQADKRFEQIDKRITELREDMNKRFEQADKRFEQVNRELDRLVSIMVGVFAGQIALVGAVIGFAWWDRKTVIRKAKEETLEEMEKELRPEKFKKLLNALREKAQNDKELADILKRYGLL